MSERSRARMRHVNKEIAGAELFLPRQPCHRQYWRKTEPPRLPSMKQLLHFPLSRPFFYIDFERILILDAVGATGKNVPPGPLRVAHELHQAIPLVLFRNNEKNETVLALEHAPR